MLTQEQIKNLKKGDPIVIRTTFNRADADGDIWFRAPSNIGGSLECYIHPAAVFLPSEHGTSVSARLFKKGDKVRIVKYNGRKFDAAPPSFQLGKVYRVDEDEDTKHCYVMLQSCDIYYAHPVAFLELVTPVEELEPYYIEEETFDYEIRNANDDPDIGTSLAFHIMFQDPNESEILRVKSYYGSYVYSSEHAEADAKAERDRLNAEWRKEQE